MIYVQQFIARARGGRMGVIVESMRKNKVSIDEIYDLVREANKQGQQDEFGKNQDAFKQVADLATKLAHKVSGTLNAMKKAYDEQITILKMYGKDDVPPVRKRTPMPKEPSAELVSLITNMFSSVLGDAESITQRNARLRIITGFMNECIEGVIDFEVLLSAKRGNILALLEEHEEGQQVMRWMAASLGIRNLLLVKPSATAGNWGPGELGLAILGTPVKKGKTGDLEVNGRDIELKASQNKDKGGRIGTTALQRGSDGKEKYESALHELLDNAGKKGLYDFSLKKETVVSEARPKKIKEPKKSVLPSNNLGVYTDESGNEKDIKWTNFGQTFVTKALNPKIRGIEPAYTKEFLRQVATSCLIQKKEQFPNGYGQLLGFINKSVRRDGTIDYEKFSIGYTKMLYTIYQAVDGKGEIMVLNPLTGSYYVTLGVDDFEEALTPSNDYEHINIGSTCIDFTDSQGKASPQIGIA